MSSRKKKKKSPDEIFSPETYNRAVWIICSNWLYVFGKTLACLTCASNPELWFELAAWFPTAFATNCCPQTEA